MTGSLKLVLAASAAVAALAGATASAQEPLPPADTPVAVELAPSDASTEAAPAMNEDEMADFLNAQQQIKQDVTLTRSVDGAVVEETKETIVYGADDPVRTTEASPSALAKLKAEFDRASLTRKEAFDEARLDFVIADLNRDDAMTADEFAWLVDNWRTSRDAQMARSRFVDFLAADDPAAASADVAAKARAKFEAMAGLDLTLDRKTYIRRVLADFDGLDVNDDGSVRGDELLHFRAANRGETMNQ